MRAQKQEGGRTWLAEPRVAVLKIPISMLPLVGCNQHTLCPFSSSRNGHSCTSGEVLHGAQCTFCPWIPIRQGSPAYTEVLLQVFREILNPDALRARQLLIYITVLACRTQFYLCPPLGTQILIWNDPRPKHPLPRSKASVLF